MAGLTWGYKHDGESCLFDLADGAELPEGWGDDVMIIADPALRTAEAITAAAGASVAVPVKVKNVIGEAFEPLRRGPGRPPK